MQIEHRLALGLVRGVDKRAGWVLVLGVEALLLASLDILEIEHAPASVKNTVTLLHFVTHDCERKTAPEV